MKCSNLLRKFVRVILLPKRLIEGHEQRRVKAYERYRQLVSQQAAVENAAEAAYSEYLKNLDRNHSLNYE